MQVQTRCVGGPGVELEGVHGDDAHTVGGRQLFQQRGLGEQQVNTAVFEHVGQAVGGVIRVERHVGAAGLENGKQADQQLRRTLGGDGHAHVRAHAFVAQVMGQAVGLGMQLGVAQVAVLPGQCGVFRSGMLVEQFGQPALGGRTGCRAPLLLPGEFIGVQQRQLANGLLRLFAHRLQQCDEVLGEARDGAGVEQFVGIVEGQAQAPVAIFVGVQLQVELGLAAVPRQLFGEQTGQAAQGAEVALLMVEQYLEQALFAGLREGFQQLLERQVLMRLGAQCGGAGGGQQFAERQAAVHLGTHHQGVDKEADQALGFMARTVGVGHADADVALAAVAVQQALEGREQEHERGGFMGLRGLANRFAEATAQAHAMAGGAVLLLRRTRVVGGQR
ncbi:MAG: hypothetical protein GAK37_02899 [Pseudomonas sp.]|nr:MAG: hypothetical protein GAK37_02899 [Pseudomonas sp.]